MRRRPCPPIAAGLQVGAGMGEPATAVVFNGKVTAWPSSVEVCRRDRVGVPAGTSGGTLTQAAVPRHVSGTLASQRPEEQGQTSGP
jgi:hypothetical protein